MNPPTLFIITGPNGAGKTNASINILPENNTERARRSVPDTPSFMFMLDCD